MLYPLKTQGWRPRFRESLFVLAHRTSYSACPPSTPRRSPCHADAVAAPRRVVGFDDFFGELTDHGDRKGMRGLKAQELREQRPGLSSIVTGDDEDGFFCEQSMPDHRSKLEEIIGTLK